MKKIKFQHGEQSLPKSLGFDMDTVELMKTPKFQLLQKILQEDSPMSAKMEVWLKDKELSEAERVYGLFLMGSFWEHTRMKRDTNYRVETTLGLLKEIHGHAEEAEADDDVLESFSHCIRIIETSAAMSKLVNTALSKHVHDCKDCGAREGCDLEQAKAFRAQAKEQ